MLSILSFIFFLEFSGAHGEHATYIPHETRIKDVYEFQTFVTLGIDCNIGPWYVEAMTKTIMYPLKELDGFFTVGITYYIEAGCQYEGFTIGVKRQCEHPIIPWFSGESSTMYSDAWGYEVFIRYETPEIKFK